MTTAKHYGAGYLQDTGAFLKQLKSVSYEPFAALDNGVVIDLGCGTGADVAGLAAHVGAGVELIGIDHDPSMIAYAQANFGNIAHVNFFVGDVSPLNFETNSIAGIRMERVLQHLDAPTEMFEEVHRVLHPAAPFVVIETIWDSLQFYTKHIRVEQTIRQYLTSHKVKNGWGGNKLVSDLFVHNFREIKLDTYTMVVRSVEEAKKYLFLDRILEEIVNVGLLDQVEVEEFMDSLIWADGIGCFNSSINLVLTKAVK